MSWQHCESIELFLRYCDNCGGINMRRRERGRGFIHEMEKQVLKLFVVVSNERVYCKKLSMKRR
jgi:hypothetical protein